MKDELLAWVNGQFQLDVTSKFILYRLAQFADADCCAWSEVATLAKAVNVSERTIQYRLRDMEAEGLLEDTGRKHTLEFSKNGRKVPIYQVAPGIVGLDRSARPAESMGAKSAPIDGDGCKIDGVMGASCCTPIEPIRTEGAYAPTAGAREIDPEGFGEAFEAYPIDGLKRTNVPEARAAWVVVAAEAGVAELVAAVKAFRADPALAKGDFGAPGLHRWLGEERWRAYVGRPGSAPVLPPRAAAGSAWAPLPDGLRASFAESFTPAQAGSYGPVGWIADGRIVVVATGVGRDWFRNAGRGWLKDNQLQVMSAAEASARSTAA
jgi:hypothetical protein